MRYPSTFVGMLDNAAATANAAKLRALAARCYAKLAPPHSHIVGNRTHIRTIRGALWHHARLAAEHRAMAIEARLTGLIQSATYHENTSDQHVVCMSRYGFRSPQPSRL